LVKEKVLVVGLGEVGRTLFELLKESGKFTVYGTDMDKERMRTVGQTELPKEVDVMHVCIPCFSRGQFVKTVAEYVKKFKPRLVINNSTVMVGTTMDIYKRCGCLIAHSPIAASTKTWNT